MAITVRLPPMLRHDGPDTIIVTETVHTIEELVGALRRAQPRLAAHLDDTILNFAVNDEMLIHSVPGHPLNDGDVVEIVPAISGG